MGTILLLAVACGIVLVRGGVQAPTATTPPPQKKLIDLKSDLLGPVAPGDSVIFLVRNFAAQHNGAVITCDSAVRYSDMRIEFFGNVLINKNTTYIYGDRAEYDGTINEARIYSDLVKVVDGDATLYTYTFRFNTKSNIGEFAEGGFLINRESQLESERGYYYADTKLLVAVDRVQMRNEEYELKGDSVVYHMESDNAFFYDNTHIWSREGDYLYADRGAYEKQDTLYIVTKNGYLLSEKQEMWSDTINFYRAREHVYLYRDIQLDDTEQKVLAFGDYGEYWKNPGNALLTRNPSLVSYDTSQSDSLFLRSDTIELFTINTALQARLAAEKARADSLAMAEATAGQSDEEGSEEAIEATPAEEGMMLGAEESEASEEESQHAPLEQLRARQGNGMPLGADSLAEGVSPVVDSLAQDSLAQDSVAVLNPLDTMTVAQRKAYLKEQAKKEKEAQKRIKEQQRDSLLERIAFQRQEKITRKLLAQKEREEARLAALKLKAESKLAARRARAERKGKPFEADSTALQQIDSLIEQNNAEQDSLLLLIEREWQADSLWLERVQDSLDSLMVPRDSIYRLMKGYRNVRAFRTDFQMVCDSLISQTSDSTIHLYITPVLWSQSNQITSEVMDIYTQESQLLRAEFVGTPMMVAELDTMHYNQVKGKEMVAHFRDNAIYRNDVNGNAQTIYYMEDGEPPQITGVGFLESGDASFLIEQQQVVTIIYRTSPTWDIYPMDKIPESQSLFLPDFKWEGARRPTREMVAPVRIRPSERAERSQLPHPDFPIQQRIEEHKKYLLEQRCWTDRMDQVDEATVEWMNSLGFEVGQPRKEGEISF